MIHVASSGEMPFVSDVRKTRSIRVKTQNESPSRKLALRPHSSEKFNAQEIKRIKFANSLSDSSDDKHRSGHLRAALVRLRQTVFRPKSEKYHLRHNNQTASPRTRLAPTKPVQRKSSVPVRKISLPPRLYTVCEECLRRCAHLDVIMEEDFDEDNFSDEIESKIQLISKPCCLDKRPRKCQSLPIMDNSLLSV